MNKPFVVGITGGIGSGKSTVAAGFRAAGFVVYDSDAEARRIQNEDQNVRRKIIHLFGNTAYKAGKLDRPKIASIVFENPGMLEKLTAIVHPAVVADFRKFVESHSGEEFIFLESAVLFESGLHHLADFILLVTASEKVRIRRVMLRDNITENQVKQRIKNQITDEKYIKLCDLVIENENKKPDTVEIISKIKALQTKKGTH